MSVDRTPETRDVYETSLAHEASFVSAVRSYGNLGPFRPLDRELFKGVRVFDMLVRPQQIVCASTVRANQDIPLYGNWGVIIGAGDILQAYPYDATSYTSGDEVHSPYSERIQHLSIDEQIENAINTIPTHNEVNIALGKNGIAGFFYKLGAKQGVDDAHYPSEAVESLLKPYGIPSYWLHNGSYYQKSGAEVPDSFTAPVPLATLLSFSKDDHPALDPEAAFELSKSFLAEELTLPPRNPISAGILRAQSAVAYSRKHHTSSESFVSDVEQHMEAAALDARIYGAVAVHAYRHIVDKDDQDLEVPAGTVNSALRVVSEADYASYSERLLPNGNLRITEEDLSTYVKTNSLPPYLGKI